jgi:hypothetical protein
MQPANTVRLDNHAVASLRYIRSSMEAAGSFAVPGSAGIAMGSVALIAAMFSSMPRLHAHWLGIWLAAAMLAAGMGGALMARPASLRGLMFAHTPVRKFALCLFPSLFAGAIMTAVHVSSGNFHAIPGTWLLLYGCALVSACATTTRLVGVLGALFLLLGLLALALPDGAQMLLLGAGFGGLHVLFGFLIGRMERERQI